MIILCREKVMNNDNDQQTELFPVVVDTNAIILKFETTEHCLDATLMGKTLLAFSSSIVGLANSEHLEGTKVSVCTVQSGCIEIGAVISTLQTAGANLAYISALWEHLKSLYELFSFLKGLPPKTTTPTGNQITVENQFGQHATFNNSIVNQYIISSSTPFGDGKDLLLDKNLSGVTVLDGDRHPILSVPRNEFKNLVPYKKISHNQSEQIDEQVLLLTIATVNLDNPYKSWSFIDETGLRFSAHIEDESFIAGISSGAVAFRQGDKIQCRMETIKKFNAILNTFEIKRRNIKEILYYAPRILASEPSLPGI